MNENNAVKYIKNGDNAPSPRIPEHTRQLLRGLGNPARKMKIIKVYGEVGKSALALRLSRMLSETGYSVGLVFLTNATSAPKEAILWNGASITGEQFTQATNKVAEAIPLSPASQISPTSEELLLATGLVALEGLECNVLILQIPCIPHSATTALDNPLLNIITKVYSATAANTICSLLDKTSEETVSSLQDPNVTHLLTERCAQINCRLTCPIKSNFYKMDYTLGKMRFFYDKKEYVLSGGALYEADTALALIESYQALGRRGLRLAPTGLASALYAAPEKGHFSIFSVAPTVLLDCATTPPRLAALRATLQWHQSTLGNTFDVWTAPVYENEVRTAFSQENVPHLSSLVVIDEKNPYKAVKLALRDRSGDRPLIVLGDSAFISYIDRTLKGFL